MSVLSIAWTLLVMLAISASTHCILIPIGIVATCKTPPKLDACNYDRKQLAARKDRAEKTQSSRRCLLQMKGGTHCSYGSGAEGGGHLLLSSAVLHRGRPDRHSCCFHHGTCPVDECSQHRFGMHCWTGLGSRHTQHPAVHKTHFRIQVAVRSRVMHSP